MRCMIAALCLLGLGAPAHAHGELLRSFLPSSRSVFVGEWGTVFMALTNSGNQDLTQCSVGLSANPLRPSPAIDVVEIDTNGAIIEGTRFQVFNMAQGQTRHFLIGLRPNAGDFNDDFKATGSIVEYGQWVVAGCSGTIAQESDVARLDFVGFSGRRPPDILPVIVTPSGDGILHIDGETQRGVAAVAAINLGEPADLVFNVDAMADVDIRACQTDTNGACLAPRGNAIPFRLETNETALFSIIAVDRSNSLVANAPELIRLWVNFDEVSAPDIGARSSTSVAINDTDRAPGSRRIIRLVGQWRSSRNAGDALLISTSGEYVLYSYRYEFGRTARFSIESIGTVSLLPPSDTTDFQLAANPAPGYEDGTFEGAVVSSNNRMRFYRGNERTDAILADGVVPNPVRGEFVGFLDRDTYSAPFDENLPRLSVAANGQISGQFIADTATYPAVGSICTISGQDGGTVTVSGCSAVASELTGLIYLLEDDLDSVRAVIAALILTDGSERYQIALFSPDLQ